jgi:multiple inositol-polyphosphate phosphatase/2,3-bisphosphoglycerate 3-phosphatase
MKKLLSLLLILSVGYNFIAVAQTPAIDFLGTKTLYKAPAVKYMPAPAGYAPVFINHVGRHGARHLTKEVNTSYTYGLLLKADSIHALTPKGQKLWQMVMALDKVEKGSVKSISIEGQNELKAIGERMYAHYGNVFKGNINLNVGITKEIRTKQSADAFLSGLKKNFQTSADIKQYTDDTNLRFYDFSPVYKQFEEDGDWLKYYQEMGEAEHIVQINNAFSEQFFKADFLKTLDVNAREKFVNDIFGFATIVYSLKDEVKQAGLRPENVAFISLFTPAEIKTLSKLDLADDYYKKGPGINNNGIQVRIAAPLLANFIKTADGFMKGDNINAQLRFAHAETISPIAALMGITTANKATTSLNIGAFWQASQVIPLSSNIQWIFYKKNGSDNYLVKVLLNEKEAHIAGMEERSFPYYKWDELRQLYINKLQQLHVGLDDDMSAYLKNLK